MNIAPFDQVFVRNKNGADWNSAEGRSFVKMLKADLAFDGIKVSTSHFWTGDTYQFGPLLAINVKVQSPKNVYFDYSKITPV
jgi:hypothetical protein